jgi:hypothetical protein
MSEPAEVIVIGGFEVLFSLAGSSNLFLNCSLWTSPQFNPRLKKEKISLKGDILNFAYCGLVTFLGNSNFTGFPSVPKVFETMIS